MSYPTYMSQSAAPQAASRRAVVQQQPQQQEEAEYLSPAEIYEEYNYPYYGYGYGYGYGGYRGWAGPHGFHHPYYAPYSGYAPQGFGGYGDPYGCYPGRYGYGYPGYLQPEAAEDEAEDKAEDKAEEKAEEKAEDTAEDAGAMQASYDVRRYGYNRFGIPGPYGYGYGYGYHGGYYGAPWGYGYPHPAASYGHPGPYPLGFKESNDAKKPPTTLSPAEALHQQAYDFQPDISGSYPTWARRPPRATVGIDVDGDGIPDYYYSGVDRNRDGIPDALQRPRQSARSQRR